MAEISKQALIVENNTSFPNNNNGAITPSDLRSFNIDMIDSLVDEISYNQFSASVTNSISLLNVFSSSQQPTFTALNAFTASQLVLNTGYNNATSSLSTQIGVVSAEVDQLQTWSGSVNQILFNGISAGYSTRFNFGGFLSASLVQNVNGTIADINYLQDPTKLNTGSFNAYTASTAATQSIFSASVATSISSSNNAFNAFSASQSNFNLSATASLVELLNLSSSLSGGYATQGELDASASALQNNIDTKLFTASFEVYTASFSQSVATDFSQSYAFVNSISSSTNDTILNLSASVSTSLESLSASIAVTDLSQSNRLDLIESKYATTGSNTFVGTQTITGSVNGGVSALNISSNTASIDLATNNLFTLDLVSGSATHLTTTNIRPGQTINLLISQPSVGTGSVTYDSTLKFPAGANYIATPISGAKDIITFITFDSTAIYAASINNLL
jgi:hypothetical protein